MAHQQLIIAIGRIERVLSRIEQAPRTNAGPSDAELLVKHDKLKTETRAAIADLDRLISGMAS